MDLCSVGHTLIRDQEDLILVVIVITHNMVFTLIIQMDHPIFLTQVIREEGIIHLQEIIMDHTICHIPHNTMDILTHLLSLTMALLIIDLDLLCITQVVIIDLSLQATINIPITTGVTALLAGILTQFLPIHQLLITHHIMHLPPIHRLHITLDTTMYLLLPILPLIIGHTPLCKVIHHCLEHQVEYSPKKDPAAVLDAMETVRAVVLAIKAAVTGKHL